MHGPTIQAEHKNQHLNAVAIIVTIAVGAFTLYYLVHQTKLLRLQIDKHEEETKNKSIKKAL